MISHSPPLLETGSPPVEIEGRPIAPGLGLGRAWVIGDLLKCCGAKEAIHPTSPEHELARLRQAYEATLEEFEQSARRIEAEFDAALAGIFRAHGAMLRDLFASGEFERELNAGSITAEMAVQRVLHRWYQRFEALENKTFRERADDVLDLGRNIIRRLGGGGAETDVQSIPNQSVLVVERLLPSDVVRLPKSRVAAIVVESLGQGSHAALLAREKGIPTVTEIPSVLSRVATGTELLVDGYRGRLVISPAAAGRAEFQERYDKWHTSLARCKGACQERAHSRDGQWIRVDANIGIADDVDLALDNGADGVGLLRIEQLYFSRNTPPTEAELLTDLKRLITPLRDKPVTIRLLDAGGDKPLPYLRLPTTSNPVLGRRGVRLLLDYVQLLRTQLGALLSLAQERSLRILIPMVTLVDDARKIRELFDSMCVERKLPRPPELGAMIETPAAALQVPALLKHVEFLCVGTNDLTQYTLAAARDDAAVNEYYQDSHASILRLLTIILADSAERPVTLCGELAGRESWVPRLLQMGFRSLSVAPTVIPTTKDAIRTVNLGAL